MSLRSLRRCCAASLVAVLGAAGGDALAPVRPVTDSYFGTSIVDPYRYMETNDPAYRTWKTAALASTRAMLATARAQAGFAADVARSAAPARLDSLAVASEKLFYERHPAEGDRIVERDVRGGPERIVLAAASDGPRGRVSFGAFAVSADARAIALHTYARGAVSDIRIVRVSDGRDIETPLHDTFLDDVSFTRDGRQIDYVKDHSAPSGSRARDVAFAYRHTIGRSQRFDAIALGPGVSPRVEVPPNAWVFVDASEGPQAVAEVRDAGGVLGSRFYTAPSATVGKPGTPWRPLGTAADRYSDIAVHGTTIDLATNVNAPNYMVVRGSLIGRFEPRVVLPSSDTVVVSGTLDGIPKAGIFALNAAEDADYVELLDRGNAALVRIPYDRASKPVSVALPLRGSILEIASDPGVPGAFVDLTSWADFGDVYAFDPARGALAATGLVPPPADSPRVAEELTATAADGTPVGVSIVHRPGIALDGSHPLILEVTGAFGFSFTPDYRLVREAWLARGGIYAFAHVRGGGELGEAWHRAGMGALKSNTWNDLIAVATRLIEAGYTSPKRLDLYGTYQSYLGGIAPGIAIGRAIEVRPDLFAAAAVDAPAFDMLRSETTTVGRQSISEFGSTATRAGFEALQAMSPYEHVASGQTYPPLLARAFSHFNLGADWQAAKMVARLQSAAGRSDAAYLDVPREVAGDERTRDDLRDDLLAFFLAYDAR